MILRGDPAGPLAVPAALSGGSMRVWRVWVVPLALLFAIWGCTSPITLVGSVEPAAVEPSALAPSPALAPGPAPALAPRSCSRGSSRTPFPGSDPTRHGRTGRGTTFPSPRRRAGSTATGSGAWR
ncbi:hypothetical protein [Streptosporangium vulgare]|uniref:hypothetical protein n=1 Tax=Streptosporangium vulgare TaxID=46190 RepID=UPI0031E1B8B9